MKFIIEKQGYFDVEKISILKTYTSRVIENENINTNEKNISDLYKVLLAKPGFS